MQERHFSVTDMGGCPPDSRNWEVHGLDRGAGFTFRTRAAMRADRPPTARLMSHTPHFTAVARFVDDSGYEVFVIISRMPREVDPADWYEISLPERRAFVLEYPTPSEERLAFGIRFEPEGAGRSLERVGQARVFRNQARVLVVEVTGPPNCTKEIEAIAKEVFDSFEFLEVGEFPFAEPLTAYVLDTPAPARFLHPASWSSRPIPEGVELGLICEGDCIAKILVRSLGLCFNASDVFGAFADIARRSGLRVIGAPILACGEYGKFAQIHVCDASAAAQEQRFDLPMAILENGPAARSYAIALIGPSRRLSSEWWAISKAAFAIVRDTLCDVSEIASLPER